MSAEFAKFAEAATKTVSEAQPDTDFTQCLAETMQQLSQNNEQLQVRGIYVCVVAFSVSYFVLPVRMF